MEDKSEALIGTDRAALRDAAEILAVAQADEEAAIHARRAIRDAGLPELVADAEVASLLAADETVAEVRSSVALERHLHDGTVDEMSGRLYLTTQRLLLLGRYTLSASLADVEELSLAAERLLVTLRDGTGLSIDAGRPRLLRVQIAAAVEAARNGEVEGRSAVVPVVGTDPAPA
jgi:hypothetical protein